MTAIIWMILVMLIWAIAIKLVYKFEPPDTEDHTDWLKGLKQECQHTSVPWPVLSDGVLVAWLCEECKNQREIFRAPPPKIKCAHLDYVEVNNWENYTLTRMCQRCGLTRTYTLVPDLDAETLTASWVVEGEEKPSTFYDRRTGE